MWSIHEQLVVITCAATATPVVRLVTASTTSFPGCVPLATGDVLDLYNSTAFLGG